jgi:hypothetical protein
MILFGFCPLWRIWRGCSRLLLPDSTWAAAWANFAGLFQSTENLYRCLWVNPCLNEGGLDGSAVRLL